MADSKFTILIESIFQSTGIRLAAADVEKLGATAARMKNQMQEGSAGISALKSNIDSLSASLGVGAGLGALLGLAHAEAQLVGDTQRLSFVLGLTVEETSRWAYASEVATGSSEGLAMGAFHAANAIEEIRSGLGKGAEAARRMGIESENLRGIPDLFLKIGDFIKNSTLPQEEKLELAHQLLGRSARELYPLLARGADGMQALGAQADAAGRVIDQQMVEAVKKFNLTFLEFQNQLKKGIGLPVLEFAVNNKGLVEAALGVVVLTAAWKTFQSMGITTLIEQIGTGMLAYSASLEAGVGATVALGTAVEGLKAQLLALAPAATGALVVLDAIYAAPKIYQAGAAGLGLLGDIKRLSDTHNDEVALEKRAAGAVARGRARGARIRAGEEASASVASSAAPAAPRFQAEDAATRISGEEEGLSEAKSDVAGRQNARNAKIDELKDAAEVALDYSSRKAALKALHDYEIQAEKEHRAELVEVGARASQLAIDQEKSATHDREQAKLQAEMSVGKPDEGEKRKSYDESVAKEDQAHAKVLQIAEEYGKQATDSDKRQRDIRARQLSESFKDERQQQEAHFEAIAGDEKRSVSERIAAIRALAEAKKKTLGAGEREKVDVDTAKQIGSLETKTEAHAPSYQVDSLAKIGGFVGNSIPTGGGDKQSEMAASLKAIQAQLASGIKTTPEQDAFKNLH